MDGTVILLVGLLVLAVYIAIDRHYRLVRLVGHAKKAEVTLTDIANTAQSQTAVLTAAVGLIQRNAENIVALDEVKISLAKSAIVISTHAEAGSTLLARVESMIQGRETLDGMIRDLHTELLEIRSEIQSRAAEETEFGGRR